MKKRIDKDEFYRSIHDEFIKLNKTGRPNNLRDMFRKSQDSYEQAYIYTLLTDDEIGVCKYIKTKDLFTVQKEKLIPDFEKDMEKLCKLFNLYKKINKDIDLSHNGKYGYIYILDNKSLPNMLKIGFTCKSAFERAKQLSNTSIPFPFKVRYLARVRKPEKVEEDVHQKLDKYRVTGNREFFQVSLEAAVETIENCATYLKKQDSSVRFHDA